MLRTLECGRFDCKHNHNSMCTALDVIQKEKRIEIWNVVYSECITYEESGCEDDTR